MSKKECDIIVVEKTESDNGYDWWYGFFTGGEIYAESVADLVTKVLAHVTEENCCIKSLTIVGHGCPGTISVGNGQSGTDRNKEIDGNEDVWGPELDKLKPHLCEGATLYLRGCNVGADAQGADKLHAIARRLGIPVTAPTGTCRPLWTEGDDVTAKPGEKPTPVPGPDGKKKKKKGEGSRTTQPALMYRSAGIMRALWLNDVTSVSLNATPDATKQAILNKKELNALLQALNEYESFSGEQSGFKIQGYLHTQLRGRTAASIGYLPPSFVTGGYRYIVLAGDWSNIYPVTPEVSKCLRKYLLPSRQKTKTKKG
jgi:Domain of unknown function (DUF4347)